MTTLKIEWRHLDVDDESKDIYLKLINNKFALSINISPATINMIDPEKIFDIVKKNKIRPEQIVMN